MKEYIVITADKFTNQFTHKDILKEMKCDFIGDISTIDVKDDIDDVFESIISWAKISYCDLFLIMDKDTGNIIFNYPAIVHINGKNIHIKKLTKEKALNLL